MIKVNGPTPAVAIKVNLPASPWGRMVLLVVTLPCGKGFTVIVVVAFVKPAVLSHPLASVTDVKV